MKKRWLTFIMTALVIGMLSGCGQTEKRETETKLKETKIEEATEDKSEDVTDFSLRDINVDDYVTLGEYKGLVIELEGPEVTDEELDEYAYEMYDWFLSPENGGIMDRAVENGDVVNVDYEGTVNGETFEGGTGESMSLYIGSGQYVDGIEEGLIGVMPGETVTLQLLFPEEFVESPAAGEEVEFTVTVNFIVPETMEDEVIAAFGLDGVETVDDFRNMFHDTVLFNKMEDFDQEEAAADKIIEVLADNCTYVEKEEFPQEMIELYEEDLRSYIEEVAKEYDMEAEEVAETLYGLDMDTTVYQYAVGCTVRNLTMQAIANREGLNVEDEEFETLMQDMADQNGQTLEAFKEANNLEILREDLMVEKVQDFLIENAEIEFTGFKGFEK